MRTPLAAITAAVLALVPLSGCGGDADVDSFCASYQQLQRSDDEIITAEEGLEEVQNLADTAPDEIQAEAETARDGYQAITDAVQDAGFELSDLDDSEALSQEQREQLAAAAQDADYSQEDLDSAFSAIDEWTRANCGSAAE